MPRKTGNPERAISRKECGTRLDKRYDKQGNLIPLDYNDLEDTEKVYKPHSRRHIASRSKKSPK